MPNWCTNKLIVIGEDALVNEFAKIAEGPMPVYERDEKESDEPQTSVLSFHRLVPIPNEILNGSYDSNGYYAELQLWGCKWGAMYAEREDVVDGVLQYNFDTPWSPPIPLLLTTSDRFPGLTFDLQYEDSNVDLFGRIELKNGHVVRQIDWDTEDRPRVHDQAYQKLMSQCVQLTLIGNETLPQKVNAFGIREWGSSLANASGKVANQVDLLENSGWNCYMQNDDGLKVICTHCDVGSVSDKENLLSEIGFDATIAV